MYMTLYMYVYIKSRHACVWFHVACTTRSPDTWHVFAQTPSGCAHSRSWPGPAHHGCTGSAVSPPQPTTSTLPRKTPIYQKQQQKNHKDSDPSHRRQTEGSSATSCLALGPPLPGPFPQPPPPREPGLLCPAPRGPFDPSPAPRIPPALTRALPAPRAAAGGAISVAPALRKRPRGAPLPACPRWGGGGRAPEGIQERSRRIPEGLGSLSELPALPAGTPAASPPCRALPALLLSPSPLSALRRYRFAVVLGRVVEPPWVLSRAGGSRWHPCGCWGPAARYPGSRRLGWVQPSDRCAQATWPIEYPKSRDFL